MYPMRGDECVKGKSSNTSEVNLNMYYLIKYTKNE